MKRKGLVARVGGYASGLAMAALLTWGFGWTGQQVLATTIFLGFILGTLLFWRFRLAFGMLGVLALLAGGVLDIPHLIEFASLDVILFLIGMMIVIAFLRSGASSRRWSSGSCAGSTGGPGTSWPRSW